MGHTVKLQTFVHIFTK